jgi:hypothetical protein
MTLTLVSGYEAFIPSCREREVETETVGFADANRYIIRLNAIPCREILSELDEKHVHLTRDGRCRLYRHEGLDHFLVPN